MQQTGLERRTRHGAIQALFVILALSVMPPFVNGQSPATPKASNEPPQKPASEQVFYVESWKTGSRQIKEQSFHIKFDNPDQEYKSTIEGAEGKPQYRFVVAHILSAKDYRPVGWVVELFDESEKNNQHSLLRHQRGQADNFIREDNIASINSMENPSPQPLTDIFYPLAAKRVIKSKAFTASFR